MGYDFSELDTELAALGTPPANAVQLAYAYAGTPRSLVETDAALDALGRYTPTSPPEVAVAARLSRSGEIALPDPVPSEAPKSSEVSLDTEASHSGSFALSDLEDDDEDFEAEFAALAAPDPAPAAAASAPAPFVPAEAAPAPFVPAKPAAPSLLDDDPLLALFDSDEESEIEPAAIPLSTLSAAPAAAPATAPATMRDPDAEFDALFEEATRPSDLPPSSEGSPSLEAKPSAARNAPIDLGFEDDLDDPTNIVDRASLAGLKGEIATSTNGFADDEELPSSEFEIVLEDDEVETAPKSRPQGPPPPLDKRPSFLGRLFGPKKD